jgi:hypothetical protein
MLEDGTTFYLGFGASPIQGDYTFGREEKTISRILSDEAMIVAEAERLSNDLQPSYSNLQVGLIQRIALQKLGYLNSFQETKWHIKLMKMC